jgi:multidrug efflux pump subunit AcrA (membrane-fusion protein)
LARCTTVLGEQEGVMWLPPQAIRTFQGRKFVVLQDADGRQRRVDVEVGLQAQDRVEVKSGLSVGDVVVAP